MNYSRQRSLILDIVKNTKSHPTAEWVYLQAKKELPSIGIATVYRNLNALVEMGECRRLVSGDGQDRFDGTMEAHFHMKCTCCGGLTDLEPVTEDGPQRLQDMVRETFSNLDEDAELDMILLKGICEECRARNKDN